MGDFTELERAILVDIRIFGHDRAANIARRTDYTPEATSKRLNILADEGYLQNKGHGVYRLTDSGRESAENLVLEGFNPYVED